mgnify:CR=1 FL=1
MSRRIRVPGEQSRSFVNTSRQRDGNPRLILDWNPSGSGDIATGSYGGTETTIDGQQVFVFGKTSGDSAETTSTLELTATGLHVVHVGGSGETTALRLVLTDNTLFPNMDKDLGSVCVTASFSVASFNNASSNISLLLEQEPIGNTPNTDHVQHDVWITALRYSASDWRVRSGRSTGADAQSFQDYGADTLSGSEPSNVRLTFHGSNGSYFAGGDATAGPGTFQGVGLGTNQLRMIRTRGASMLAGGVSYPIIAIMFGRGESTAVDVTLTNLSVWTYG